MNKVNRIINTLVVFSILLMAFGIIPSEATKNTIESNPISWFENFSYPDGTVPNNIDIFKTGGSVRELFVKNEKLKATIDTNSYGNYTKIRWRAKEIIFNKLDKVTLTFEGYEKTGYNEGNNYGGFHIMPITISLDDSTYSPGITVGVQNRYPSHINFAGYDSSGNRTEIASDMYQVVDGLHYYKLEINHSNGIYQEGRMRFYRDGVLEASYENITTFMGETNYIRFEFLGDDPVGAIYTWDDVSINIEDPGSGDNIIFEDDFSTDKGWIDESDGYIYRDITNEWLVWNTDRQNKRLYYIPINAETSSIRMEYKYNITGMGGNGALKFCLAESLTGAYEDVSKMVGACVLMDHYNFYRIKMYASYYDQPFYDKSDAKAINVGNINEWFKVELLLENGTYTVTAWDSGNNMVGQVTDTFPEEHNYYNYIGIFDEGTSGGWEYANGYLDDVKLFGSAFPISINHIEVTQVVQDKANTLPLISGKPTLIRVYLSCSEINDCDDIGEHTLLYGYDNDSELDGSPLQPSNKSNYKPTGESNWEQLRKEKNSSLNYLLPLSWTEQDIFIQVEIQTDLGDIASGLDLIMNKTKSLEIAYTPINYDPTDCTWIKDNLPDKERIAVGYQLARKMYPLSEMTYIPYPEISFTTGLRSGTNCDEGEEDIEDSQRELLVTLELARQNTIPQPQHLFGWLPNEASVGGAAFRDGNVAYGSDDKYDDQETFSHEIAHHLGARHTKGINDVFLECAYLDRNDETNDWPYDTGLIQEFGVEISNDISNFKIYNPDPDKWIYDYMSYCPFLKWTSPHTYNRLFDYLVDETEGNNSEVADQRFFFITGKVHLDDTASISNIWEITSSNPLFVPDGTTYCIESQDKKNKIIDNKCFDLEFLDHIGNITTSDNFMIMLPYSKAAERIVVKSNGNEIGEKMISDNKPEVTLLYPNGGETWLSDQNYTISWEATDLDGDKLFYNILYSIDGAKWQPLGINHDEKSLEVNSSSLAGSDSAKIRIEVSDGFNTSYDESDKVFTVEEKNPIVYILSPENYITIPIDNLILLEGYVYDLEDGEIIGENLVWESSTDGFLGNGQLLMINLSPGYHTITLTAADNDTNESIDTIELFIGYRTFLPISLNFD